MTGIKVSLGRGRKHDLGTTTWMLDDLVWGSLPRSRGGGKSWVSAGELSVARVYVGRRCYQFRRFLHYGTQRYRILTYDRRSASDVPVRDNLDEIDALCFLMRLQSAGRL